MKFYLFNHQNKGTTYINALTSAGHEYVPDYNDSSIDFGFIDHDAGRGGVGWRREIYAFEARGVPLFIYPHAARPMLQWDGMYSVYPKTKCNFVIGDGHVEVMQAFGYPLPIEKTGWALCPQKAFNTKKLNRKLRVVFAPIHPNANGWIHPIDKHKNAVVFDGLLALLGDIDLTVRHIFRLQSNGLWKHKNVVFNMAQTKVDTCIEQIDSVDLIIAHQTFAYLAVARGKPLMMFGDDHIPHSGNRPENFRYVQNFDKYKDILRYPVNFEDSYSSTTLLNSMKRAIQKDVGAKWRDKFIGKPFDKNAFVEKVETYLS